MGHTIIVTAGASDSAPLQYLAPYAGCAMAEEFMDQGKDVLIVYDDLTKHAWAYRRCRFCSGVPLAAKPTRATCSTCTAACWSGRARLDEEHGGGSITALPIIETQPATCRRISPPT